MSHPSHAPSAAYAALKARCPACGLGRLYDSLLRVADRCPACGLDLSGHEQGDGPAFLAILIVGALSATGAVILDMHWQPPLWVHAAIWLPAVIFGSILSLRILKAGLIAVQYRHRRDHFSGQ